jgi:hypothetical protein
MTAARWIGCVPLVIAATAVADPAPVARAGAGPGIDAQLDDDTTNIPYQSNTRLSALSLVYVLTRSLNPESMKISSSSVRAPVPALSAPGVSVEVPFFQSLPKQPLAREYGEAATVAAC